MTANEDALQAALQRLIDGTASPRDRVMIQSARAAGRLTLASGERSMAVGGDAKGSIFVSGDLSLTAEVLDRLLEEKYQVPALPPEGQLPPPARLPPGSRLPFPRNAVFVGRQTDLLALAKALLYQPEADGTAGVGITQAATGMGGLGKTQLAVEFGYRYGRFFQAVHWVQANQDISAEIAACGTAMGIQPWPEKQPDQVEATLREWGTGERRLVVFDNLEDPKILEEWLPRLGCARLLVTARRAKWPKALGVRSLPLGTLPRTESRELLRRLAERLRHVTNAELDQIPDRLGDLPLALSVAGQYLELRGGLSVEGYLAELEQAGGALKYLPLPDWLQGSPTQHEQELWNTFLVSWRELEGEVSDRVKARQILQACGYCAPNVIIPRTLLIRAVGDKQENQELVFDLGLRRLFELGLLTEGKVGVSIHPLLAEFGRAQDTHSRQAGEESALVGLVDALIEQGEAANQTGLPANFKPLRAHLAQVAKMAERAGMQRAGRLWNALAWHMLDMAEYTDAKVTYEHALAIHEQVFGPEHPEVASVSNNLGVVLQDLGDLSGAKAAFERALAIDEKAFGSEHPFVATTVNNLGLVLNSLGDLPGAKAAFERTLAIDEKVFGSEHPNVSIQVNNLGGILQELGDLAGAKASFERALAIDEKVLGLEHPNVAIRINNLGGVLQALGDLPGAKAAYERALAIDEKVYGPEHPNVTRDVNNLGLVLKTLGDLPAAKAAFERALAIGEKTLGPEHPIVATMVNNLGSVQQALGDLPAAKAAFERALTIFEKFLPTDHPDISTVKSNLQYLSKNIPAE